MDIPVIWQYVILGVVSLLAVVLILWLYNRREKRRKHAIQLANMMTRWGLDWFAETYEMYAVGDYSGLAHKVNEIVQSVRSDEAIVSKLWDVTRNVTRYVAENDTTKADMLRALLQKTTTTNANAPK